MSKDKIIEYLLRKVTELGGDKDIAAQSSWINTRETEVVREGERATIDGSVYEFSVDESDPSWISLDTKVDPSQRLSLSSTKVEEAAEEIFGHKALPNREQGPPLKFTSRMEDWGPAQRIFKALHDSYMPLVSAKSSAGSTKNAEKQIHKELLGKNQLLYAQPSDFLGLMSAEEYQKWARDAEIDVLASQEGLKLPFELQVPQANLEAERRARRSVVRLHTCVIHLIATGQAVPDMFANMSAIAHTLLPDLYERTKAWLDCKYQCRAVALQMQKSHAAVCLLQSNPWNHRLFDVKSAGVGETDHMKTFGWGKTLGIDEKTARAIKSNSKCVDWSKGKINAPAPAFRPFRGFEPHAVRGTPTLRYADPIVPRGPDSNPTMWESPDRLIRASPERDLAGSRSRGQHKNPPPVEAGGPTRNIRDGPGRSSRNQVDSTIPVGARLFRFRRQWKDLGTNHHVVSKGLGWGWLRAPPPHVPFGQKRDSRIVSFIREMLSKKVIEEVSSIRWQSKVFVVPKKEQGENRIILDLSRLNKMIHCPKFKMLSLREVRKNLPRDYFTCSIDLKDGYWHVPVTPKLRPFLGFRYGARTFHYRAMPFGLNVAPRAFTKVVFEAMKLVAREGVWALPYLDDILIISDSVTRNERDVAVTRDIMERLGFMINEKKSRLTPAQRFQWLGIDWNLSPNRSCAIPRETWEKFRGLVLEICQQVPRKKQIMSVQGLVNWMASIDPTLKMIMALTRRILRASAHLKHKHARIHLTRFMRAKLLRWRDYQPIPSPLGVPEPQFTIMTDASSKGWGIVIEGKRYLGTFHPSMAYSINVKELLVVWLALLLVEQVGASIRILVDNTQAIYTVRKGYAKTYHLRSLGELIWRRLRDRKQVLEVKHIRGSFNVLSDQLSRNTAISTEWALPDMVFRKDILQKFPNLEWDLFATSLNHKLPKFVAPCPDQGASAVDALTLNWSALRGIYMFPPTPLVSKVVEKWLASRPQCAVLVTGYWPARPWFARLLRVSNSHFRISARLQQIVGHKTVTQQSPTDLLVWSL